MLLSKAPRLLPTSVAATRRLGQAASRGFAAQGESNEESNPDQSSYSSFKRVADQSGNPVKEWMQGTKEHASAYADSAEQMYEATKRATADITKDAKEALQRTGLKDVKRMMGDGSKGPGVEVEGMAASVSHAAQQAGSKMSEAADRASEAVKGAVGDMGGSSEGAVGKGIPSARAQFESSRPEGVKARENADRKSQLTDEATTGDNPREQLTRDEHEILPSDFYTKH